MKSLVLYFFLLILKVPFNHIPDAIYKYDKFFKIFSEKNFKYIFNRINNSILFKLSLILLLAKTDFFSKKMKLQKGCIYDLWS